VLWMAPIGFKCGSGSSILGQCGSGSRVLMTKNCEFYRRSFVSNPFRVRAARILIQYDLFRIRLRIRQKFSDPTGSRSTTLLIFCTS
jgi:hypothetical protein